MVRRALEFRAPINVALAGAIGLLGLRAWPFPADDAFLGVIDVRKPWLFEDSRTPTRRCGLPRPSSDSRSSPPYSMWR